jgi:hypothetical protein
VNKKMLESKMKKFSINYRRPPRCKVTEEYRAKTEHILDFYTGDFLFSCLNENNIVRVE